MSSPSVFTRKKNAPKQKREKYETKCENNKLFFGARKARKKRGYFVNVYENGIQKDQQNVEKRASETSIIIPSLENRWISICVCVCVRRKCAAQTSFWCT